MKLRGQDADEKPLMPAPSPSTPVAPRLGPISARLSAWSASGIRRNAGAATFVSKRTGSSAQASEAHSDIQTEDKAESQVVAGSMRTI